METDSADVRFTDLTRSRIAAEYAKKKASMHPQLSAREASRFITLLEGIASSIPQFQLVLPPKPQHIKRQLTSLAAHLAAIADLLPELDTAALGYLLECAAGEQEKRGGVPVAELGQFEMMVEAVKMRNTVLPALGDLALGAQIAAKTLPSIAPDIQLTVTLAVERLFWNQGLKYSITESGFAGKCLEAVFDAGGLPTGSIKHELRKARESARSMNSMFGGKKGP